jgi:hypothetical protein
VWQAVEIAVGDLAALNRIELTNRPLLQLCSQTQLPSVATGVRVCSSRTV